MSKQHGGQYETHDDNRLFNEMLDSLAKFGVTQSELAEKLGLSETHLSRVKNGERHAARKHLNSLKKILRETARTAGDTANAVHQRSLAPSLISITSRHLQCLDERTAIEVFRDLLWSQAARRGLTRNRISISESIFTADGGVDASILASTASGICDGLLDAGTRFQIKTGEFKAWQPSVIKKELFSGKQEDLQNLGGSIRNALQEQARIVLVCFGVDFTDGQIRTSTKHIREAFGKVGFPNVNVEVWGQTQLLGFLNLYPSLCLKLMGHNAAYFRTRESWSQDADMAHQIHLSAEQSQSIESIRDQLIQGDVHHLRIWGEPGVGKTRFALELTACEELSRITIYVKYSSDFIKSSLFHELTQPDDHRFAFFVLDECSVKDCAEVWNILKAKGERVRLITIGHESNDSSDSKFQLLRLAPVDADTITNILSEYVPRKFDSPHWASFCEGSPRVAHVLGSNLRSNPDNLLSPPTHVDVWNRFIVGKDAADSERVNLRMRALSFIALFEKFGFEPPVEGEGKFIAEMAGISWSQFQEIVIELKKRRIIQGAKTLYITPRLLQVFLFRKCWEDYRPSLEIANLWQQMPPSLVNWFVSMLKYAHTSQVAEKAVEELLSRRGIFANGLSDDREAGRTLMALAEAAPKPTLSFLKSTFRSMGDEELRRLPRLTQSLVWALEKIAVWEVHFVDATRLLMRLVVTEDGKSGYKSSAASTFRQLFSLIPGMAGTQASPAIRIEVLKVMLDSDVVDERRLGLQACETALDDSPGFRMIGPEHQGLRATIVFWQPKTYGELWDAYRETWELLVSKLSTWKGDQRAELVKTIINCAYSVIYIRVLTKDVTATLKQLSRDPQCDIPGLLGVLKLLRRNTKLKLPKKTWGILEDIQSHLDGHNFRSSLERYVKHVHLDDFFDENDEQTSRVDQKLDEIVVQVVDSPELLTLELSWLVNTNSKEAFWFAYKLADRDPSVLSLSSILNEMPVADSSLAFLSGYLAAQYRKDPAVWEDRIISLKSHPGISAQFSDLVIQCAMTERIAAEVLMLCQQGKLSKQKLERWCYTTSFKCLSPEMLEELVRLQIKADPEIHWNTAIRLLYGYFLEDIQQKTFQQLPETLAFDVLSQPVLSDRSQIHDASYNWGQLTCQFLSQYPHRTEEFYRSLFVAASREWSVLSELDFGSSGIISKFVKEHPCFACDCIIEVLSEIPQKSSYGLMHWLSGVRNWGSDETPGPIIFLPQEKLFKWVDQDVDRNGYWLVGTLPKTLDGSAAGRLTRNFLSRYGTQSDITHHLHGHFHSRGWCGNASDFYRTLREQARSWLIDEKSDPVIDWIEDYMESLSRDIERAEIEEEREIL